MKPDEDYEDLDQNTYVGNARAMSWIVLAVAIAGFATLAYYAYHSASGVKSEEGTVVIEADAAPIKHAPEDPEGEEFANKDKTIYDVIAPDGSKPTEKLMPEPEHPVAAANMEDEDSIAAAQEPLVAAPVKAEPKPEPVVEAKAEPKPEKKPEAKTPEKKPAPVKPAPVAEATTTYVAEEPVAEPAPAAEKPATETPARYDAPTMVNEKTVIGSATVEAKTPEPTSEPKSQPKAASAASGAYKIQLGAYASEADAQAVWKKLSGKFGGVLSGQPSIIKAEVKGKTFYRLRAGSYATSAEAKAACAKLGGQVCAAVK